jgi:hypothetical protein
MRLLDKPILHKTAEMTPEQKKALIGKVMLGVGGGAGLGALAEYLMTGRASWKGAGLGAVAGTGVGLAADENARAYMKNLLGMKDEAPEKPQEGGEQVPEGRTETTGQPSVAAAPEERQETWEDVLKEAQAVMANPEKFDEQIVDNAKAFLFHDKQVKEAIHARDVLLPKLEKSAPETMTAMKEAGPEFEQEAKAFGLTFNKAKGRLPTEDEMYRYMRLRESGLSPEHWEDYVRDKGDFAGNEMFNLGVEGVQLGKIPLMAFLKRVTPKTNYKMTNKILGMLPDKGLKSLKGPIQREAYEVFTKKRLKSLFVKQGFGRRLAGKMAGKRAAELAARKAALQGAGKLATKSAGMAFNVILDSPALFIDPKTGKWNKEIWENAAHHDELMERREKNRSLLDNMLLGGLRGAFQPVSSLMTVGARTKGIGDVMVDAGKMHGSKGVKAAAKGAASAFVPFWTPNDHNTPITDKDVMAYKRKAIQRGKEYPLNARQIQTLQSRGIKHQPRFVINKNYNLKDWFRGRQLGLIPDGYGGWHQTQ